MNSLHARARRFALSECRVLFEIAPKFHRSFPRDGPKCRTVRGCLLGRHCDREAANHESDGSSWRLRVGLFNIRYPSANLTPASLSYRKPCGAVRFRRRGRAKQQSDVFVEVVGIGVCQELFCNLPRRSHKIERFVLSAQELVDGVPKRPFSSHLAHSRAVMWEGVTCIASH